MTPESRQFLAYLAAQPKGRVGYATENYDAALALARDCLWLRYVKHRRLNFQEGFQITPAGRAYLAGESE